MPVVTQQPADGLRAFEGPGVVPVTKQLLQLGCSAYDLYVMRLEREHKKKKRPRSS